MSRGTIRLLTASCLLTCAPAQGAGSMVDRATAVSVAAAPASTEPAPSGAHVDRRVPLFAPEPVEVSEPEPVLAAVRPEPPKAPPPPPRKDTFEMTFVGDVIFGRYRDDGYDPIPEPGKPVFEEIGELTRSDLFVGNLETPLARELPAVSPIGSPYPFGADASLAAYLVQGGFDAVSLANNHAYDLRGPGVEQTPQILGELGIVPLGAARAEAPIRVETIEREGWRVGFVAITTHSNVDALPGVAPLPRVELPDLAERVTPLVEDARASHDLVVVLLHWGDEYADAPSWPQREAAFALVEAGADLVIGHHPHVLQGVERRGHGVIAYSLGNFLFENVKDVPRQTGVLRTRFDARGCLRAVVFHPAFVKSVPTKHPAPATDYMGSQVRERMQTLTDALGESWRQEGEDLVLEGSRCPAGPGPA